MKTAIICILPLAAACSSLDPNVGGWRVEQPTTSDAAADAPVDTEPCAEIAPGQVCFGRDIRPMIERMSTDPRGKGCKGCHYRTEAKHNGTDLGGLALETLGELRKGGGSSGTRIIVPGKPDESAIVQALRGQYPYAPRMPKSGPPFWDDDSMKTLTDWITQGARGIDRE